MHDKRILLSDYSTEAYGAKEELVFPGKTGYYEFLTNQFPVTVKYENKTFKSSEALFQWGKFPNLPILQNEIQYSTSPFSAWKTGKDNSKVIRKDWGEVRDGIMKETLYLKFSQNRGLMESLLTTGEHKLVNEDIDAYWGRGVDGFGENRMGQILVGIFQE